MKWKQSLAISVIALAMPLMAETFHLNPTSVVPAATGTIDVGRDNNGNTQLDIHVENLAMASELSPARSVYVVWLEAPGVPAQNAGELNVGGSLKGELKTVTPLLDFDVVVTAENNPRTTSITGPVVLKATVHQSR